MDFKIAVIGMFLVILVSIQYTLNKILIEIKNIKTQIIENKNKNRY